MKTQKVVTIITIILLVAIMTNGNKATNKGDNSNVYVWLL